MSSTNTEKLPDDSYQNYLNRQEVKRIVRRLEALPSLPVVATEILNMFIGDDPDLEEVIKVIETDQALTMKLLKLVNSAYFGFRKSVSSVSRAVALLGLAQLRSALLSVTVSENLIKPLQKKSTEEQETLWKHSLACAVWAEMLAEEVNPTLKTEAFVGGLLHDIGKLILEECFPERYSQVRELNSERDISWMDAEQDVLKIDHTMVGKWLAEKWGLPQLLVEAIWLHHHTLSTIVELDFLKEKRLVIIVYLANILAHESMVDSMVPYHVSSEIEEVFTFLKINTGDIEKLKTSVGKRYSERTAVLDMKEEDELSFYYEALQRANQKLAKIASKGSKYYALEKANKDLGILHSLHLEVAQINDVDVILERVNHVLMKEFEESEGIVYYLNTPERKLMGRFWVSGKKSRYFEFELNDDCNPVSVDLPQLHEQAGKLIRTCHARFVDIADKDKKFIRLQYCKPFLIIPMIMDSRLVGEILLTNEGGTPSETLTSMDLETYKYLASITATALIRTELLDRVEETAEDLSKALSRNGELLQQLTKSKQRFEDLFEYSNDAIIVHNRDGEILRLNQRAVELLGYSREEIKKQQITAIFPDSVSDERTKALGALCQLKNGGKLETELQCKDGKIVEVEISSRIVDESAGIIQSIIRDISGQKEASRTLLMEKEKLAVTLKSIGEGVISTDSNGKVVLINNVAENLTGYKEDEVIGKPFGKTFKIIDAKTREEYANPVQSVLETGDMVNFTDRTVLVARDHTERKVSGSGAPIFDNEKKVIGVIIVFRDITLRKKMEEELLEAQKLESVGTLAGGIAHDFNNILTAIIGNISLAKMYSKTGDTIFRMLTEAEKASMQAKNLTQQLLTFSMGGAPIKQPTSISGLIRQSADFCLRGSNVDCEFFIQENLWAVEADEGQISQVINNLILNAVQAMPDGGEISVQAENVTLDKTTHLPLAEGKYVKISIVDQGIGIPGENLSKIFEPYFTTKQEGHGLGLATCYSIIRKHGGYVSVESKEGIGTTFYLYLPASEREAKGQVKGQKRTVSGKGRILVMDDDEDVKTVLCIMLEELGYQVDFASNGDEAIEIYRQKKEKEQPFDLVIMDLTVKGGMGGKETIKKLSEIDPGIRAVVSSGYYNDPIMAEYKKHGFKGIITKPYTLEELSTVVDVVLRGNT